MEPNSTVMTVVVIFKSRVLKMPLQEKFTYLHEVTSKIKHVVTLYVYASNGIKISTFLKKKIGG